MSFILGKFYLPVLRFTEKGRSVFKVYSSRFVFVTYNQFSKRLGGCPALVPGRGAQSTTAPPLNRSSRSPGRRRPVSFIFLQADNSNIYSLFCARQVYFVEKSPGTCLSNTIDSWLGEEHCRPKESSNIELDNIDRME